MRQENKKLKKENKSLKSKVDAENDMTEDEQRASDYLEKISRDHLVKLEVGYELPTLLGYLAAYVLSVLLVIVPHVKLRKNLKKNK